MRGAGLCSLCFCTVIIASAKPTRAQTLPEPEVSTLAQLYGACTGWLFPFSPTNPCGWPLVECSAGSDSPTATVVAITIPYDEITCTGGLPTSLEAFTELRNLSIRTFMAAMHTPLLPRSLRVLHLSRTGFTGTVPIPPMAQDIDLEGDLFEPGFIVGLPATLVSLRMSDLRRVGLLPSELPVGLISLDLSNNALSGTVPVAYGTGRLRKLALGGNSLAGEVPSTLEAVALRGREQHISRPLSLAPNGFDLTRPCKAPPLPQWIVDSGLECSAGPASPAGPPEAPAGPNQKGTGGTGEGPPVVVVPLLVFLGAAVAAILFFVAFLATRYGRLRVRACLYRCCNKKQAMAYDAVELAAPPESAEVAEGD
eukprot:TRINITY_DN30099_c0_g1_i1.p1 TRINITY_DN30099_c0_g1~~TRINITY_DN30099_c0_g1_i1.p1  ORF type:complete len:375 (-),score=51.26 TRINITY_DN30099_c0_g1_i1:14-1117(-)